MTTAAEFGNLAKQLYDQGDLAGAKEQLDLADKARAAVSQQFVLCAIPSADKSDLNTPTGSLSEMVPAYYDVYLVNNSECTIKQVEMRVGGHVGDSDGVFQTAISRRCLGELASKSAIFLETLDYGMLDFVNWYDLDLWLSRNTCITLSGTIHYLLDDPSPVPVLNRHGHVRPTKVVQRAPLSPAFPKRNNDEAKASSPVYRRFDLRDRLGQIKEKWRELPLVVRWLGYALIALIPGPILFWWFGLAHEITEKGFSSTIFFTIFLAVSAWVILYGVLYGAVYILWLLGVAISLPVEVWRQLRRRPKS